MHFGFCGRVVIFFIIMNSYYHTTNKQFKGMHASLLKILEKKFKEHGGIIKNLMLYRDLRYTLNRYLNYVEEFGPVRIFDDESDITDYEESDDDSDIESETIILSKPVPLKRSTPCILKPEAKRVRPSILKSL